MRNFYYLVFFVFLYFSKVNAQLTYCSPSVNTNGNYKSTFISNVQFGNLNNSSALSQPTVSPYYTYYPSVATSVVLGTTVNLSITIDTGGFYTGAITSVWIDWNIDGILDASEHFYVGLGTGSAGIPSGTTLTVPVTIPTTAYPGITRMRIRTVGSGEEVLPTDACTLYFDSGETEDYNITLVPPTTCSGTPTAGTPTATLRTCNNFQSFTLSATGATVAANMTYQWQSSPTGTNNFVNIVGATNMSYIVSNQSVSTDYRFVITCTTSNTTATSNAITVAQLTGVDNFYEDFETTLSGSPDDNTKPECWSYIDTVISSGYGFVSYNATKTGNKGYAAYRAWGSTPAYNGDVILVSPQTNNLGNGTKQIRFWSKKTSSLNTPLLEIYSLNGIASTSTKTLIQTINLTTKWKEYTVPLPITTDDYIGFSFGQTGNIELDDIYYEDLESCIYPTNIEVNNITQTSATINWTASVSSTVTAYEYEIRYMGAPGSGITGLAATGIVNTPSLTANISGLSPSVFYSIYVRSICGNSQGNWYPVGTEFYTTCGVVNSNFFEGFEAAPLGNTAINTQPDCWGYIDTVQLLGYGYVTLHNDARKTGNQGYYVYRAPTNPGDILLISPETDNLGNGTKQLRFWAKKKTLNPPVFEIYRLNGTSVTATRTLIQAITLTNNWEEYIVPLPVTNDDYFAFSFGQTNNTYIDDIYYEDIETCLYPTNVTVSNITQTGATLNWAASISPTVTAYEYEVRSMGLPGSGTTGLAATGVVNVPLTTASITGLSASVSYTVYVRAICGTSTGRWVPNSTKFYALCNIINNSFFEGFDTTETGSSNNPSPPICWTYLATSAKNSYGYTSGYTTGMNESNGFSASRISTTGAEYDGDILLISPETNNLGNCTKQLRFWAKVSFSDITTHKFEVYSMSDKTATATKTLLKGNIPLTDNWQEFIVPLPTTTDDYFAFSFNRQGGSATVYLDNIYYEDITIPAITALNVCNGKTIADINNQTKNYIWYVDSTTTTALPTTTVLQTGDYYIAQDLSYGCTSARANIAVTVYSIPASPTGQTIQAFNSVATIADLLMNETNVLWFASYNDAVQQINQLPQNYQLQHNETYYGILIGEAGCVSNPTAVYVTMFDVSTEEFDLAALKYYPNPTDTELNIEYVNKIKKIEIFTLSGQLVISRNYNTNQVKIDLSELSAANYIVKIQTADASQIVKIIKK